MTSIRTTLAATVALCIAAMTAAAAQDAPAAAPAQADPAPLAAPQDGPADAAPAAPGTETTETPPDAPPQPEIEVVQHGDWEVGCLEGTTNCEMQQVAQDEGDNPVILVRLVRLPADADALALAVFNTPLGTLLPPGVSFQIDSGETASLPFEWCVEEGCVVRLGLREQDIAALKRGRVVNLRVASIADPETPVALTLSLSGFTAAYDSLAVPVLDPLPAE